ncbi:MAG: hypothetical protein P8Z78_05440 [Gammaproteobacteria bacterium]|jgi:hypothetical protein
MKLPDLPLVLLLSLATPAMADYPSDLLGHSNPKEKISDPDPGRFSVCFKHTCAMVEHVSLSPAEWLKVADFFSPEATTAEEERRRIAEAIAWLEIAVGSKVDALDDRGGNLEGFTASGNQLDCVDESTNSTTYLRMMQKAGFLKFHRVERTATRGGLLFGGFWPHSTAVVSEIDSGRKWAVDSWFFDNGEKPTVVLLKKWRTGWSPEGAKH